MSLLLARRKAEQRVKAAYAMANYWSEMWGQRPHSEEAMLRFRRSVDELDAALSCLAEFVDALVTRDLVDDWYRRAWGSPV